MKILIFHSTAGEGHRKIGEAAAAELATRREVHSVSAHDALETAPEFFRKNYTATYFNSVAHCPKLWGWFYEHTDHLWLYPLIRVFRRIWNGFFSKKLLAQVRAEKPDVIICTHFYSAEVLGAAKLKGKIQSRLITIITDVMPHAVWVNPGTNLYWVMAEESKQELIRRGIPETQIRVGGIPVKAEFSRQENRDELIRKLNLEPNRFNILFSSGSFGIGPTKQWLEELTPFADRVQAIVICGKNEILQKSLQAETFPFPTRILGFVDNMHEWMSVSEFMVAKSGGSTMSESLAKNLPMLISAPIPGQETRNANWLMKQKTSLTIEARGELRRLVNDVLQNPGAMEKIKGRIRAVAKPTAARDLADEIIRTAGAQHG